MLRRDTNASFHKTGAWIFSRHRFVAGAVEASKTLNRAAYDRVMRRQHEAPVLLLQDDERRRNWWLFRDEFYWDDDGYNETEVKALLLERLTQKDRRVRRAVALMEQAEVSPAEPDMQTGARARIPDDVKVLVWQRDRGRCVHCESRERLEFDHVIPLAMGGANTARNLQLLCEACNRAKGASLF